MVIWTLISSFINANCLWKVHWEHHWEPWKALWENTGNTLYPISFAQSSALVIYINRPMGVIWVIGSVYNVSLLMVKTQSKRPIANKIVHFGCTHITIAQVVSTFHNVMLSEQILNTYWGFEKVCKYWLNQRNSKTSFVVLKKVLRLVEGGLFFCSVGAHSEECMHSFRIWA
jgi:hypothetical protein